MSAKNEKLTSFDFIEISIFLSLIFLLFFCLFFYCLKVMPYSYGDTAFLIEIVDRLSKNLGPTSYILSQNVSVIALATVDITSFCKEGLFANLYTQVPFNWLTSLHAYLILYPISIVAKYIGSINSLSVFHALSFATIPAVVYSYMRLNNQKIFISFLTTVLIMFHPTWLLSSTNQFYVDRFYPPFAIALSFLTYKLLNSKDQDNKLAILIFFTMLVGGSISERAMAVSGIFLLFSGLIQKGTIKRKLSILFFGLIALIYVFIYTHKIGGTPDNSRFFLNNYTLNSLINTFTYQGIGAYLFFNAFFFLITLILNLRVALSILPILLINCLVTVGGAEKDGWLTHYHSHYYGFLVAAFVISITHRNNQLIKKINLNYILLPLLALLYFGYHHYHYYNDSLYNKIKDVFIVSKDKSQFYANSGLIDKLLLNVPNNASTTSTEWGLPILYMRGNNVHSFPLNIGISDYLILQFLTEKNSINSSVRFTNDNVSADLCYTKMINKHYVLIQQEGTLGLFKKKLKNNE